LSAFSCSSKSFFWYSKSSLSCCVSLIPMFQRFVWTGDNYTRINFSEGSNMSDSNNKEILIEAPIKVKGEDDQTIKEFKLSWAGKIFFAGAAAYILGSAGRQQKIPIKVRGTPQQVKAIVDAVIS